MTNIGPLVLGAGLGALLVRERNARLAAERMAAALFETLLNAIDANDAQTGAHVRRVASYTLIIADAAGLDEGTIGMCERIALFHDIGKVHEALFDIIHEHERLSPSERRAVATHPQRGAAVLAPLKSFYPELADSVVAHHERWDGTGYPRGLRGDQIPIGARIVAIADTFDAITHKRRYRTARSAQHAADALAEGRGTQFDPDLIDLVLAPPVWARILRAHRTAHQQRVRPPGPQETSVPDVKFRWRTKTVDPAAGTYDRVSPTP